MGIYKMAAQEPVVRQVVIDVKRLKELEEEFILKRMFADLSLDHSVLIDVVSKKNDNLTLN
jgi:hypothetical protein